MKAFLTIQILLIALTSTCQPSEIDSIRRLIATQKLHKNYTADTLYILNIAKLAHLNYAVNADSAFYYARMALNLSREAAYAKGIAESERQIGNAYMLTGDMTQAIEHYQQSLTKARQIKNLRLTGAALSNIGLSYISMGKYDEAIDYALQSQKIAEQTGDSLMLAGEQSNLSDIYFAKKEYCKAYDYGRNAMQTAERLHNKYYTAFLRISLGSLLVQSGRYDEALPLFDSAFNFYKKTNDRLGLADVKLQLAKLYKATHMPYKAIALAQESYTEALQLKAKKEIAEASEFLGNMFEETGNSKEALKLLRIAKRYNDSLMNDQTQRKLYEQAAKYNYEQKELALIKEQAEKELKAQRVVARQQHLIILAAIFMISLVIVAIVQYRDKKIKQQSNQVLQEKNKEIIRQKEEIEQQAQALEKINAQKNKLFTIIAHDLRGPLSSLQGLLKAFKDGDMTAEETKAILSNLNINIDGTVNLVTNLLSWALSQLEAIQVKPCTLLLYDITQRAMDNVYQHAKDKEISLANHIPNDAQAIGDPDMIELVIRNLLSNATKFCREKGKIWVTAETGAVNVKIGIHDNGIGMRQDIIEKIERGETFSTFGTGKEKGTGLGLLLCKDFIERNNGSIHIESTPGEGSHFYFTLPLTATES